MMQTMSLAFVVSLKRPVKLRNEMIGVEKSRVLIFFEDFIESFSPDKWFKDPIEFVASWRRTCLIGFVLVDRILRNCRIQTKTSDGALLFFLFGVSLESHVVCDKLGFINEEGAIFRFQSQSKFAESDDELSKCDHILNESLNLDRVTNVGGYVFTTVARA